MERSTRFFSLSGWAGILAGVYALVGFYFAYKIRYLSGSDIYYDIYDGKYSTAVKQLILIGILVFIFAVSTAMFMSWRTAKKNGDVLWTPGARKMFINMAIPLVTGGILSIVLVLQGLIGIVAPLTLIFYGLSLIIAGNYTYSNIKVLGIAEIILGLIAAANIGYGLFFWALGFGVLHIVYGVFIYVKYRV